MIMNIAELREKSESELKGLLLETNKELFKLRLQRASNELKQNHLFGVLRKQIARINTILADKKV